MRALALAGLVASVGALGASVAVGGSGGLLAGAVAAGVFVASLRTFFRGGGAAAASPGGSSESRFLVKVVGAAFALRIAATILLHYGDLWRYLGGDEETFDLNARVFANWVAGQSSIPLSPRFLGSVEVGYFYLVGSLYHTFGVHKFLPLLLNALLGASLVLPVHALAGRFAGRVAARRAAILIAIFPSLVLWSSLMVRDVLALFAIAAVLLQTDRLRKSPSPARLLAVLGLLACLATLRTYIFLIVAVALSVSLVLGQRNAFRSVVLGGAVMVALILSVRYLGIGESELERANLETLAMHRQYNALGPSVAGSLGTDVDISTPTAALGYLPVGLVYFYLSPLPWQIGSPRQVLSVVDLLLWYSILPSVATGLLWMLRRRFPAILPTLLTVVGISVLYALVEGNIGIIFRHRSQVIVPLCAVAGVGVVVKARARRRESRIRESAVPVHASEGRSLRAPAGLRVPGGAA